MTLHSFSYPSHSETYGSLFLLLFSGVGEEILLVGQSVEEYTSVSWAV